MNRKSDIDRPFQSRAAQDFERSLIAQYREIASPALKAGNSNNKPQEPQTIRLLPTDTD